MAKQILLGKFSSPDERRSFEHGNLNLVKLGATTVGLARFEPGWKWSNDVKPIAKTESCQAPHTLYVISGRMHVVMDDGESIDLEPGDCAVIPPGHDAWTQGDDACVAVDFTGAGQYATQAREASSGAGARVGATQPAAR